MKETILQEIRNSKAFYKMQLNICNQGGMV